MNKTRLNLIKTAFSPHFLFFFQQVALSHHTSHSHPPPPPLITQAFVEVLVEYESGLPDFVLNSTPTSDTVVVNIQDTPQQTFEVPVEFESGLPRFLLNSTPLVPVVVQVSNAEIALLNKFVLIGSYFSSYYSFICTQVIDEVELVELVELANLLQYIFKHITQTKVL